jgi:hypothetical protein
MAATLCRFVPRAEMTKLRHIPLGLVTQAQQGNPEAYRTARLFLTSLLLEVKLRRSEDASRRVLHERTWLGRKPDGPG